MLPSNPIPQVCDYGSAALYRELPNEEQIRSGVVPLDSLPAAWWNCMWYATNQAVNCARYTAGALIDEINTVLTRAGVCVCDTCVDQLYTAIENIRTTIGNATTAGAVKSSSCPGEVSINAQGIMTANCVGNAAALTTVARTLTGAINELKSTYDCCISDLNTATGALDTNKAPVNHASTATTYGVGNATTYGHVKLSDTYSSCVGGVSEGVAASQKALYDAYDYLINNAGAPLGNTVGCALGTASAGSCNTAARSDHVHPVPSYVACAGYASSAGDSAALNGHSSSVESTANTIARRSNDGYLNAAIFHDDWYTEDINIYANSTLMFRSPDGYLRNTVPENVSVGYASSAGSAGSSINATRAEVSRGVSGGFIGAGSGTVYAINESTICNGHSRPIMALTRASVGYGVYFTKATIIAAGTSASVANFADGWDVWYALY